MSGGVAFVLDDDGGFDRHCNQEMVSLETVTKEEDARNLRGLIEEHLFLTGSTVAAQVLEKWNQILPKFVMVVPVAYKKMSQGNRTATGQQIGSVARG
jgi:glutamate synthase domain-containing protein 3